MVCFVNVSASSWALRKAVWALRRLAVRASQSWRRKLKLLTSSERKKRRTINLMNPCKCLYFFVFLHYFHKYICFIIFLTCLPSSFFSVPSMRLACKDFEQQRKLEEKKLKGLEGKKKEQAERLGMGLGMRRYDDEEKTTTSDFAADLKIHICFFLSFSLCSAVSHSVTSDMHIIQQESPLGAKTNKGRRFTEDDDDEGSFSSRSDKEKCIYVQFLILFLLLVLLV